MPARKRAQPGAPLTKREKTAMDMICQGKVLKEIAAHFGVCRITAGGMIAAARDKYGARTTPQAAIIHWKTEGE